MGNQQLLLIALGTIIVGIAVVVGINLFTASYGEHIKDIAIQKIHEIGMEANAYRLKPSDLGGGGGTYVGFDKIVRKGDDLINDYRFVFQQSDRIYIYLRLTLKSDKGVPYFIWGQYTPTGLKSLAVYEPDKRKWIFLFEE